MDFLSHLTMKGKETAPCLVLNSVSNLPRAIAYLNEKGSDSVRAFLDNNQAGRQALQSIIVRHQGRGYEPTLCPTQRPQRVPRCSMLQTTGKANWQSKDY